MQALPARLRLARISLIGNFVAGATEVQLLVAVGAHLSDW